MTGRRRIMLALALLAAIGVGAGGMLLAMQSRGDDRPDAERVRGERQSEQYEPDSTTVADCTDGKLDCLEQAYANLAYESGAKAALADLQSHVGRRDAIDTNCHRLTHAVGYGTLRKHDGDVGPAFAEGDSTCWSGYFHGVLEQAFVGVGDRQLDEVATGLCTSDEVRATRFLHYQCVHGLGHGLMLHTNYELPAALEVCEAFDDSWESTSCDGGVFMENVNASTGGRSKYLKDDDLVYPCNDVTDRHKLYCYLMLTSRVLQANGYDWQATARMCREDAEPEWRDECFQSYGRDASGQARRQLPPVVRTCSYVDARWLGECVYGAARDMVSEDAGPTRAARFCASVAPAVAGRCAEGVGTIVATLHAAEADRASQCRSAMRAAGVARLSGDCMRGAVVTSPALLAGDAA